VFRVGPLGTGPHLVQVRGVNATGAVLDPSGTLGLDLSVSWNVVSASNSTLTLTDITDGLHTLKVCVCDGGVLVWWGGCVGCCDVFCGGWAVCSMC
jgi:hypothetical protein